MHEKKFDINEIITKKICFNYTGCTRHNFYTPLCIDGTNMNYISCISHVKIIQFFYRYFSGAVNNIHFLYGVQSPCFNPNVHNSNGKLSVKI